MLRMMLLGYIAFTLTYRRLSENFTLHRRLVRRLAVSLRTPTQTPQQTLRIMLGFIAFTPTCGAWVILLLLGLGGARADAQSALGLQFSAGSHARSLHAPSAIHAGGLWYPFYTPYGWIGQITPFYSNCFSFANCVFFAPYQPLRERRPKSHSPAKVYSEPHQPDAAMKAWRASLQPAPAPFRTDERLIQPQFRNHSLIRSEFEQTGKPLPSTRSK